MLLEEGVCYDQCILLAKHYDPLPCFIFNIEKTKIMAYSPITSRQIYGQTMETVTDFIFLVLKSLQMVTAAMK